MTHLKNAILDPKSIAKNASIFYGDICTDSALWLFATAKWDKNMT